VDRQGHLFTVARNSVNGSEFCGGTFSPDGRFLFVNMQTPGLTLAIEGPWDRRAAGPVFDAAAGRRGPATAPARRT
jgi:secreted PhoX family phosphatase